MIMKRFVLRRFQFTTRWAVAAVFGLAMVSAFAPAVHQAHAAPRRQPWQNMSPAQLTAAFWQWLLNTTVSASPVFDNTGANFASNQPYFSVPGGSGDLLFLGGTFTVD